METSKTIHYTEAGAGRLKKLRRDIDDRIEAEIRRRKYVPGETEVEVTASDVEELARSLRVSFYHLSEQRLRLRNQIMGLYMVLGALTLAAGVFYPLLADLLENPPRLMLIVTGVAMTLASYFLRQSLQRGHYIRSYERLIESLDRESKSSDAS